MIKIGFHTCGHDLVSLHFEVPRRVPQEIDFHDLLPLGKFRNERSHGRVISLSRMDCIHLFIARAHFSVPQIVQEVEHC